MSRPYRVTLSRTLALFDGKLVLFPSKTQRYEVVARGLTFTVAIPFAPDLVTVRRAAANDHVRPGLRACRMTRALFSPAPPRRS
jgi:hypothetical protein